MKDTRMEPTGRASFALAPLTCLCVVAFLATPASSDEVPKGNMDHNRPEHGSLSNIGAKLTDPTSDIWALQFNIQGPTFYDGDLNSGDSIRPSATTTRPRQGTNGTSPSGPTSQRRSGSAACR